MICDKQPYDTAQKAADAVKGLAGQGKSLKSYLCHECNKYHLASTGHKTLKPLKDWNLEKELQKRNYPLPPVNRNQQKVKPTGFQTTGRIMTAQQAEQLRRKFENN